MEAEQEYYPAPGGNRVGSVCPKDCMIERDEYMRETLCERCQEVGSEEEWLEDEDYY